MSRSSRETNGIQLCDVEPRICRVCHREGVHLGLTEEPDLIVLCLPLLQARWLLELQKKIAYMCGRSVYAGGHTFTSRRDDVAGMERQAREHGVCRQLLGDER